MKVSIRYPPSIVSLTDVFSTPVDPGSAVEIRCKVVLYTVLYCTVLYCTDQVQS